jgi:hypothetical protein
MSMDLRLTRLINVCGSRFELIAEVFNLFNRANFDSVNSSFGLGPNPLPSFGTATSAYDPRQVQFGVKVSF